MTAGVVLRSSLFFLLQLCLTPPFSLLALLTFPLPAFTRYRFISLWTRLMMLSLRHICGIDYRVLGAEHIPATPCVVLSKHQSAWETFAFQLVFPPQVYVTKRELLWIPFFGWGLAMCSPIAIDRSAGPRAVRQMLAQGKDRISRGFWVIVYPEGTRMAPGQTRKYGVSGALLACEAGAPVVPIAHNSGYFWPRRSLLKHAGTIRVVIGPPIDPTGLTPREVNERAQRWIEAKVAEIVASPGGQPR